MGILKCGYLGPPGTYSEQAGISYFTADEKLVSYNSIYNIFEGIQSGEIDRGLVPIENSLEGAVNVSMDLLYSNSFVTILAELIFPINNCLLVEKGVGLADITKVYSHPQPIGQSNKFINSKLAAASISYTASTAEAAEIVKGSSDSAVIGSERISGIYGLEVIAKKIQDNDNNFTRFFVIANKLDIGGLVYKKDRDYKTSLICAPRINKSGALYNILGDFAEEGVNLTRIESRPTKRQLGEYLFYIDFEGHRQEKNIKKALDGVQEKSSFFRVLGSYLIEKI